LGSPTFAPKERSDWIAHPPSPFFQNSPFPALLTPTLLEGGNAVHDAGHQQRVAIAQQETRSLAGKGKRDPTKHPSCRILSEAITPSCSWLLYSNNEGLPQMKKFKGLGSQLCSSLYSPLFSQQRTHLYVSRQHVVPNQIELTFLLTFAEDTGMRALPFAKTLGRVQKEVKWVLVNCRVRRLATFFLFNSPLPFFLPPPFRRVRETERACSHQPRVSSRIPASNGELAALWLSLCVTVSLVTPCGAGREFCGIASFVRPR